MHRLKRHFNSKKTVLLWVLNAADLLATLTLDQVFSQLLDMIEAMVGFNQVNETNFTMNLIEVPFIEDSRAMDRHIFAFNQLLSVINYHILETVSLKMWRFFTEYYDQNDIETSDGAQLRAPINVAKLRLVVPLNSNRTRCLWNFLKYWM